MITNKVKRVNSLNYVRDGKLYMFICSCSLLLFNLTGPKTDSPVTSPRVDQQLQSLVPSQLEGIVTEATTPTRQRRRSSDITTPVLDSVTDSGYGRSLERLRRSVSLDHSQHPPPLNLPDREQHKPDGKWTQFGDASLIIVL